MKIYSAGLYCRKLILACLLVLLGSVAARTQTAAEWEQLRRAERYITASRTDEALRLLDEVAGVTDNPTFNLTVAYQRTRGLTKQRKYPVAAANLVRLIDDAESARMYDIKTKALIGMAYIHQRQFQPKLCLAYLDRADELIEQYELPSLAAMSFNRRAAYYREYGDLDQTLVYARRALTIATEHEDAHQMALAHLLLSLAMRADDPRDSEHHLKKAARYYHNTGSTVDYLVMTLALNTLQIDAGRMREALVSNDSAMIYASKVQDRDSTYVSRVYANRAKIMHALKMHDSTYHYMRMAHTSELEHLRRTNNQRAVEVEANYANEKKSLLISEQQALLKSGQERRKLLMIIVVVGTITLCFLMINYQRLRRAKRKLEEQYALKQINQELTHSLTEQKILQGEVHHRVKNNLQVIISLLELQQEELEDPAARASLEAMAGRVYSMAAVHESLYQNGQGDAVDFGLYVAKMCEHFEGLYAPPQGCAFTVDIKDYWFNLETAIPLGTMLNELLTNSFKYGTQPNVPLLVDIKLFVASDSLCLKVADNGPGYPDGSLREREGGLGAYLLNGMSRQLQGRIDVANEDGAVARIYFKRKNDNTAGAARPQHKTAVDTVTVR
jgi:two-component sensor histidine kinase